MGTTVPTNSEKPAVALTGQYAEGPQTFDFRRYWHSFVERIWIVAVCVLAGLFLALGNLARTPKLYQGHTVLEVEAQEPTFLANDDPTTRMRSTFLGSYEGLRTIEQNLTNQTLLARVVRSEGLAEDGGRALLGQSVVNEKTSSPARRTDPSQTPSNSQNASGVTTFTPLEEGLGRAIVGMVKPVIRRGPRLLDLYAPHHDPAMAQRLAEAVGREYIRYSIERKTSLSEEALRYLLQEEERLKANLRKSEAAVAEYKAKNPDALQLGGGTVATGSQQGAGSGAGGSRGGLVEDNLQDLNGKLIAAKTDQLRLEGELEQVQQVGDKIDALLKIPSISAAPMVTEARRNVIQMEAAMTTYALRYKDKHPKMISAKATLAESKEKLRQAVMAQPTILRNTIEQIKATQASLENALHNQQGVAVVLNRTAIGYQELARQAETDRALYESVLRQIKDTNLTKDAQTGAVTIVEHSPLSRLPVSPSVPKAILLGLFGGLAVGLGFVYVSDLLDRSIKTVDQAETTLALPVLAAVPEIRAPDAVKQDNNSKVSESGVSYRLMAEAPEGPVAEAFRNLRASLSLLGPETERKVFLFTSAVPSEGKSFTSVNYALALAQQGYRVLLIDGYLRRPSLHKVFQQSGNGEGRLRSDEMMGIVDYRVGTAELRDAARTVLPADAETFVDRTNRGAVPRRGELSILAGGRRAPNPAELLSGNSFKELLAEAAEHYDRVVIDSAPILAVSDTLLMVPYVQTSCIVVRANRTPRNAVSRAFSLLAATGTRPAGIILNRLPRHRGAGYYYYYASHGYGAGEGSYAGRYSERATTLSTPETRAQTGSDNGAS